MPVPCTRLHCIAKNYFDKDFQIITVKTEHKCVLESCHSLEKGKFEVHYLEVNEDGLNNITIDALENVPDELNIYVHDIALNIYHDLRTSDYEIFLNSG